MSEFFATAPMGSEASAPDVTAKRASAPGATATAAAARIGSGPSAPDAAPVGAVPGSQPSTSGADLRVGNLTESELLAQIFPLLGSQDSPLMLLGPGDDAALLAAPDGRFVVSTDTQVQDFDFRLHWPNGMASTGFDVGFKAAAQNLSDINAMGAAATGMVVSLSLPELLGVSWVLDLARGLRAGADQLGAPSCVIAGGDLSGAQQIVVTVTVFGDLEGHDPVLRSGARPGNVLAHAGNLGSAGAGWAVLESSPATGGLSPEAAAAVELFHHPQPPLTLGPVAAQAGATAMLDVSDGLVKDAGRIAAASGAGIELDRGILQHYVQLLEPVGEQLGVNPWTWILGGGEDHGLLATFDASAELPHGFTVIGSVISKEQIGQRDGSVFMDEQALHNAGWDHFAH